MKYEIPCSQLCKTARLGAGVLIEKLGAERTKRFKELHENIKDLSDPALFSYCGLWRSDSSLVSQYLQELIHLSDTFGGNQLSARCLHEHHFWDLFSSGLPVKAKL